MRRALVRIDRMKLAMRLFRSLGTWPDEQELHQWMRDAGFVSLGGSWYAHAGPEHALLPEEVLETATSETSDGITFVDRRRREPRRPDPNGQAPQADRA